MGTFQLERESSALVTCRWRAGTGTSSFRAARFLLSPWRFTKDIPSGCPGHGRPDSLCDPLHLSVLRSRQKLTQVDKKQTSCHWDTETLEAFCYWGRTWLILIHTQASFAKPSQKSWLFAGGVISPKARWLLLTGGGLEWHSAAVFRQKLLSSGLGVCLPGGVSQIYHLRGMIFEQLA